MLTTPLVLALALPLATLEPQEPAVAATPSARTIWGDFDADGLPDVLVIGTDGRATLLANAGDGSFRDHTTLSGLELGQGVWAAQWGDADGDGWPDLVVLGANSRLWRNLGDGTFADVTRASGLELPVGADAVAWLDYDCDEAADLLVSTPTGELLFHNEGAGRFERVDLLRLLGEPAPVTVVEPVRPGPSEEGSTPTSSSSGAKAAGVSGSTGSTSPRAAAPAPGFNCPPSIEDSSFPGLCLPASSIPTMGALFPIGPEFFISPAGNVGINTTSPNARLAVDGRIRGTADIIADGQLRSQVLNLPPLEVLSTQRVPNLNADLLDGVEASAFSQLGASIEGSEVTDGTLTSADLGPNSVGSSEISSGAVGISELADGSVNTFKIIDGSIGGVDLATGSVTGTTIADGTVTDAEISASAAISGSKIAPLFTGPVGIGTTTPGKSLDVIGDIRASGLVSGQGSWSSNPNANSTVTALNTGTGSAAYFEVKNSSSTADALRVLNNGLGRTAFISTTNVNSTKPVIEAGTFGNGEVLYGITYGKAAAAYLEVQNSTSTTPGALYVKTNGVGDGIQVHHSRNGTEGIYVNHTGDDGWGIWSRSDTNQGVGVRGESRNPFGYGVWGYSDNIGVVGTTTNSQSPAIWAQGSFSASGSKNFVQPHPTDASKEVVFTCLEGNESGTYFRGTAELSGGRAVIEVPEEFGLVTEAEGLSVQLTPVGARAVLWVERQDLDEVVVRGDVNVTFHYQVNGVRRGFTSTERIRESKAFVPELRGVPYGTQYPDELRQILVENGTLNPDFTPNEATAAERGWTLREPGERDVPMLEAAGLLWATPSAPAVLPAGEVVEGSESAPEPIEEASIPAYPSAPGERVPMVPPSSRGGA